MPKRKTQFSKWLSDQLVGCDMSMETLSDAIGISRVTLNKHISGRNVPNRNTLALYADYFHANYAILSQMVCEDRANDARINQDAHMEVKGNFGNWLYEVIQNLGLTIWDVCDLTGLNSSTIYAHLSMDRLPTMETIKRYCRLFGVNDWSYPYELALEDRFAKYERSQYLHML